MAEPAQPFAFWVDAQLPPALARWLRELGEGASHVQDMGLLDAIDPTIFDRARDVQAVIVTKDADFVRLQEARGAPPRIVWITCGNIRNRDLRAVIVEKWSRVRELLRAGEILIEISDRR